MSTTTHTPAHSTFGNGSQATQNKAHREDLTWIKVGRSEYMRSDGLIVRKNARIVWWEICNEAGEPLQGEIYGEPSPHMPAGGPSLTIAKFLAEKITANWPIY